VPPRTLLQCIQTSYYNFDRLILFFLFFSFFFPLAKTTKVDFVALSYRSRCAIRHFWCFFVFLASFFFFFCS
jgi:hypothetical protein